VVEGGVWGGVTTAPIAQEIMSRLYAMDKGAVEKYLVPPANRGNFNGIGAVDTATNINSNKPSDTSADNPDNNDASVNAPAADAPPSSARSSNSGSSSKKHGR